MGNSDRKSEPVLPQTLNADYIDAQYRLWQNDPATVTREWRHFFEGFELGAAGRPSSTAPVDEEQNLRQSRVEALKYRYRDIGHLQACMDPLVACPARHPLLNISAFMLTPDDLDREFYTRRFSPGHRIPLKKIIRILEETYCRSIGVEYMHLQDPAERRWLRNRMETRRNRPNLEPAEKLRILNKLFQAALFEAYLNKKFTGITRFSIEGAESLIPLLDSLLLHASAQDCREVIIGMAHRGRLNVQCNILYKLYEEIFREFVNKYTPDSIVGSGDVKYHNGYLSDIELANQQKLRVFLVNNPSHLESVNPVAEGIARARQDLIGGDRERPRVLPILIHGDAAFAGQGVVSETLNLSQLEGYRTGGTVHIVINNQIGYTTLPEDARSTRYSTDIAKMLMVPIFHVHGENPEALVHVVRLAHDYRMKFGKDVVIDMICYRRYGHNEGDEPYFTQPQMYARIKQRPPLHQTYAEQLSDEGLINPAEIDKIGDGINQCLEEAYQSAQDNPRIFPQPAYFEEWKDFHGRYESTPVKTGVESEQLRHLSTQLNTLPEDFTPHPKIQRLLQKRLDAVESGQSIDWANAEALGFASLIAEGMPVRLSGQDCQRGTFSQRHSVLTDMQTGTQLIPLNRLKNSQALFTVFNSMLSETGVLGFEYGYSTVRPHGLVIWEAQFGDFANNAQSVIDLYIVSGQSKWQRLSGLVMLLPHGLEGLGPEHSSARMERFLQLCADDNIQVCNPTTPAQYFHLLRRQSITACRIPLVVMTPKSLLRHPAAVSCLDDLSEGSFQTVLDDPTPPESPQRVLFCSGKIFYTLMERRQVLKQMDTAIIRIEQFYPLPRTQLEKVCAAYRKAKQWFWVQEEPENMGGWDFIRPHLNQLTPEPLVFIGRKPSPSPATGFANIYRQEQADIPNRAVGPLPEK